MNDAFADPYYLASHPWPLLAGFAVVLLLSAFLSLAQAAITTVPRGKLKAQADRGARGARSALGLQDDDERMIGAVLLGQLLLHITATVLAMIWLLPHLLANQGAIWPFALIAAMSLGLLILTEVLPKTIATASPEAIALTLAPILAPIVAVLAPVVGLLSSTLRAALRPFGLRANPDTKMFALREDIMGAIALGHSTGAVEKEDRDRLLGALDLSDRTVDEIMRHRRQIEMINADDAADEIIAQVLASAHSRLPIFKDDEENILGFIHAKDLLREVDRLRRQNAGADISATIAELDVVKVAMKPYFIPDTTSLDEQMRAFLARNAHMALVVDEYGSLQGLITLEDILEEIVGEINDEFDAKARDAGLKQTASGDYIVDGAMTIRDINRAMDWNLPDDEANTVAGLVIHEAQMIPTEGQAFIFHGFRFQVVQRRENRVVKLWVRGL